MRLLFCFCKCDSLISVGLCAACYLSYMLHNFLFVILRLWEVCTEQHLLHLFRTFLPNLYRPKTLSPNSHPAPGLEMTTLFSRPAVHQNKSGSFLSSDQKPKYPVTYPLLVPMKA